MQYKNIYNGSNIDECPWQELNRPIKVPKGWHKIDRPKPRAYQCGYNNPESQGTLICQTVGFPDAWNPKTHDYHSGYSDRMHAWDAKRMNKACDFVEAGPQMWWYRLCPEQLPKFAQILFDLQEPADHVRAIYYYNVANGYDCPVIIALSKKT